MTDTLTPALTYAARGWRIIPIAPGEKYPAGIPNWQERATTDPAKLATLATTFHGWGVGIATGRASGLWVLDVDDRSGGADTLADLEATYEPLPPTYEVLTPGGGRHLYWAWPDGAEIRNDQAGRLGPGLDVRGEGGQVLAPPTLHPNGGRYERELGSPDEVAPAPGWLVALLTTGDTDRRASIRLGGGGDKPGDRMAANVTWPEMLVADGAVLIGARTEHSTGERYELWSRPAMAGETGFTPHTSASLYYKGSDVLKVFTPNWQGVTAGEPWSLTEGETYTRFGYWTATRHHGDYARAARAADELWPRRDPAPGEGTEGGEAGGAEGHDTPGDDPAQDVPRPHPLADWMIDWPALFASDVAADDWLCEPFIARARAHAMYARAGDGKSLVMLYVAAALATGRPVLRRPAGRPVRVLYVDWEMTPADLVDRFGDFGYDAADADLLAENLFYVQLPSIDPIDTPSGAAVVVAAALHLGVELVVIDTTTRAVGGEENEADTYRAVARELGVPLKAAGIAYIRLDHAGKDGTKGMRGSSSKRDDVDVVWHLEKRDGGFLVKVDKTRVSWVRPFELVRVDGDDGLTLSLPAGEEEPTWPDGTWQCVDELDRLGVPLGASSRQAQAALREAGEGRRFATIQAAIKARKWRRTQGRITLRGPGNTGSGTG